LKKIISAAAICACLACAVSCGSDNGAAEFTKKETQTAASVLTEQVQTEEVQTRSAETTAASTETVTETTAETTTTTAKPVALSEDVLENRSFVCSDFPDKVYSNKKLQKALDKIDSICSEYSGIMSFAYMNMDTGALCTYRADVKYGCCSTVKAPFCKNLLASGIDLDEKIAVNGKWSGDSGTVASMAYGTELTAREMIRYAITQSDNTAYYNLVLHYGWSGFNEMNYSLGSNYTLGSTWIFNYCTANDLLKEYVDIYNFAETNKKGKWLIKLMTKTDVETQVTAQLADKYTVAHKYGSDYSERYFHDCAIVYADSPFVLVIMTNQYPETEESCKVFRQLAKQFDIVNSQLAN
jgi:hypothetical protein